MIDKIFGLFSTVRPEWFCVESDGRFEFVDRINGSIQVLSVC